MDIVPILGAGATIISVTLALVGFIMTQARSTRDAWQAADRALSEGEAKARHTLANTLQAAVSKLEAEIDRLFLERFDCSEEKYRMAKAIAGLQEPILRRGSQPRAYSLYIGIPFCPSRCSYCSFVSCNLDRDRRLVQNSVDRADGTGRGVLRPAG